MTPHSRRKRAHSPSPPTGTATTQSDTVEHQSTSSNIPQFHFPASISTQHARSLSHQTEPTSPTHELHRERDSPFIDLNLCRPSSNKLFNHPLAPPSSFSHPPNSILTPLVSNGERTVFSKSHYEQLQSKVSTSTSQLGEFMDISPASKLMRYTSRMRLKSLDKREKVWREGGLRHENEMDSDGSIQMRSSMMEWIWNADLRKSHFELSTTMRYLAITLLTLFYADLDLLPLSPSSLSASQDSDKQIDSTTNLNNSQSSSRDSLTPGEYDVVKTSLAALALAIKFEQDYTAPCFAFGCKDYLKVLDTSLQAEELVKFERDVLGSPSIDYRFPVTPLDYLFELSISVPFFVQLRETKQKIWSAVLDAVPRLLRCATEFDSKFITIPPKVVISAVLVLAVESLSPSLFTSSTFSTPSTSPPASPTPPIRSQFETTNQDYEDDIAYDIALQEESDLLSKRRIKSTPTPVSYLSYRHLLAHGYDTSLDEEMEIIEQSGMEIAGGEGTKGDSISRWARVVDGEGGYPSPASRASSDEEQCIEDEIIELAQVFLVTLFEELDLVEDEIEECLVWLRKLHFA